MTDDERTAFDETEKAIKDIDETMTRLRELEAIQLRSAQPVNQPRIEMCQRAEGHPLCAHVSGHRRRRAAICRRRRTSRKCSGPMTRTSTT